MYAGKEIYNVRLKLTTNFKAVNPENVYIC